MEWGASIQEDGMDAIPGAKFWENEYGQIETKPM